MTVPVSPKREATPEAGTIRRAIRGRKPAAWTRFVRLLDGPFADRVNRLPETAGPDGATGIARQPDAWLPAIVERIVPVADPVRIVLFGSRARGTARDDSDYDLVVVVDRIHAGRQTQSSVERALDGLPISMDVVVASLHAYERAPTLLGMLIEVFARNGALRHAAVEGLTMYERPESV